MLPQEPFVTLQGAGDIDIAPDGSLWVLNGGGHSLQHLDADGGYIAKISISGGDMGMQGITVAADGSVWVAGNCYPCLQHFDGEGRVIAQVGSLGTGPGQFGDYIDGIAIAADGSVWVVDKGNHRLQHFKADGTFIAQVGSLGTAPGQFKNIGDIAIAADGSVWVVDNSNHRLQHFKADGTFIAQLGSQGTGPGQFEYVVDIAIAADGSVWVVDEGNHRLQHFKADGTFIAQVGSLGTAPGQFKNIGDIAIAADGSVWVADEGNDRLQHFKADGTFIAQLGSLGTCPVQFKNIGDIAIAADGSVWVVDRGNDRLQHFKADGTFIAQVGSQGSGPGQFDYYIGGIAIATAHPYKAIILAGGGAKIAGRVNPFWNATQRITQKAYNALTLQGFKAHEEVLFLTAGNPQSVDGSGDYDDLSAASKKSLRQAITQWAKDSTDVVLYLAAPGGDGQLQINATETVSAQELASWLTELEQTLPGKVTVVIEGANSGSFIKPLASSKHPRYVLTSSQDQQPAVIAAGGINTFSYDFWSNIRDGVTLSNAFQGARQAMQAFKLEHGPQTAQMDSDGDQQSTAHDRQAVGDYCLGNCNKTAHSPPVISLVNPKPQQLTGNTALDFRLNIDQAEDVQEGWALVQRPDDLSIDPNQPLNLEKIPLSCEFKQNVCTGVAHYNRFDLQGDYRLSFYAMDSHYNVSAPVTLSVTQSKGQAVAPVQYDDKQAMLYLRDVSVGKQHYQAVLQQSNDRFALSYARPASQLFNAPARFDAASNTLSIPLARAFGQWYQATFKHLGGYVFELKTATQK